MEILNGFSRLDGNKFPLEREREKEFEIEEMKSVSYVQTMSSLMYVMTSIRLIFVMQ